MNDSIVQEPQLETDWTAMNEDTDKHIAVRRARINVAQVASTILLLVVIVAVGAYFRLLNVNWDDDQHLHPDERFLTMVETALQWPDSVAQYFNSAESPLNPYNRGHTNYVYGTLPLFMVKKLGMLLDKNGYGEIHFVGRVTSALFDLGTVILVFLIGARLYSRKVGLLSAFLMTLNVLHIQNSHFFTMDTILVFFTTLAFLFAVLIADGEGLWAYIGAGLALGMAVACKISVAVFGGVIGFAWFIGLMRKFYPAATADIKPATTERAHGTVLERAVIYILLTVLIALVTFRIFQPYAFEGPGFFDFKLDERFVNNMTYISKLVRGEIDYPPSHQWTARTPIIFPLKNMILWGMGIPLGVTVWLGWAWAGVELLWRRDWRHLLPLAWTTAFFGYQGIQFVKAMRYIMPTYPMFILLGAYLLVKLANGKWANRQMGKSANGQETAPLNIFARFADSRIWRFARFAYLLFCILGTLGWAWAFSRIYTRPVTRITASRWVYEHIPPGTTIANEHWDDPLPMRVDGKDGFGGMYQGIELHLYAEDEPSKLDNLLGWLDATDYIFITSNRLYDSIPRLPMRYPMTVKYYELLFAEQLGFERIKTFTSYPNIGAFEINDDKAEETFHVYDHPKVIIFKKLTEGPRAFSREKIRELLDDVEWDKIEKLWPKQVTERDNQPVFDEEEWAEQRAGGTWRLMFNRNNFLNNHQIAAVIWWLLLLEIVSLLTFPLGALIFRRLTDKGYILHKGLGLLLLTYISWMLVNLTPLKYTWSTIGIALVLMGAIAAVLTRLYRAEIFDFWRTKWNVIAINEILFLIFFLAFMLIRWGNPDLWHPAMGGERPMDFAYLNAVMRSAEFPPYDPWFAGGKLNYYYYGQLVVATFIKLTGIVPWLAYNLTLPLFFAMTAMGAFCVVYNLQMGRWTNGQIGKSANPPLSPPQEGESAAVLPPAGGVRGGHSSTITIYLYPLAAAFFVAVLGNLSELSVLGQGLGALSNLNFESSIPGFAALVRSIDGLRHWISSGGGELPVRVNWWYWNASRVMTHGEINEFPFFTFLYSDLHAHLMALPYTIIALGLALNWVLPAPRDEQTAPRNLSGAMAYLPFTLWVLVVSVVLGALRCINTWDYPTYLFVTLLALGFAVYNQRGRLDLEGLVSAGIIFGAILVLSNVLFQPFHAHYAMPYSSLELWRGDRTEMWAYLVIHGLFLFILVTYLITYIGAVLQRRGFWRWLDLATRKFDRLPRFLSLYDKLCPPFSLIQRIMTYGAVALLAVLIFLITLAVLSEPPAPPRVLGYHTMALIFAILGVTALTLIYHFLKMWGGETETSNADIFILCLIALGAGLTLVVEIIVLKGDIGRMNTVFKFYLQVWVIWGIASAAALGRTGKSANLQISKFSDSLADVPFADVRWQAILATLIFIAALYPIFATPAKVRDRFQADLPRTLDGRAYMAETVYRAGCNGAGGRDVQYTVDMKWELEAINWLLDNLPGSPVILEGNTQPCLYQWGSRISSYTGLPTIVGWDWHQRQQRTMMPGGTVEGRQRDVRTLYDTTDVNQTMTMLHEYDVEYIYIGELERAFYSPAGIDKFEQMRVKGLLDLVYENQEVRIYRVKRVG